MISQNQDMQKESNQYLMQILYAYPVAKRNSWFLRLAALLVKWALMKLKYSELTEKCISKSIIKSTKIQNRRISTPYYQADLQQIKCKINQTSYMTKLKISSKTKKSNQERKMILQFLKPWKKIMQISSMFKIRSKLITKITKSMNKMLKNSIWR